MQKMVLFRSFGTHDGSFHADEVTACALLLLCDCIDRDKIVRTRNPLEFEHLEYVCDVGGIFNPLIKRFDHHQVEYQGYLSSAGMILEYLEESEILSKELAEFFRKTVIKGIDDIDNGLVEPLYGHTSFSQVIASFVPVHYDAPLDEYDTQFFKALDFVLQFLIRIRAKYQYALECKESVLEEMKKNAPCLIFDTPIPWMETFFENDGDFHPAQFVMMPSQNHWKLRAIPPSFQERMQVRKPLPLAWAGLLDEDLKKVSGISGAIFCHKGRFISVFETKEDALIALKKILGD
jgi:uncharacterized UPF0160 family protein